MTEIVGTVYKAKVELNFTQIIKLNPKCTFKLLKITLGIQTDKKRAH